MEQLRKKEGNREVVFSSLIFTFFFLPIIILLYFIVKDNYKNYILLVASLLFYAYGEPVFIFVMLISIIANYGLALGISRGRKKNKIALPNAMLSLAILLNIGMLFIFKYLDFSISLINKLFGTNMAILNIALPIGISFFTFQALSYVIDVYREVIPVQKNPLYLALYISFFPQLIAGPIVRYSSIAEQLETRECTLYSFGEGIRRFFLGFCKKIILANNLSVVASGIFEMSDSVMTTNPLVLWLGAISFSLQIFYDFAGYSDMAIGLGKMFGFEFEENFNYPYTSKSITEFWRRWHISLGQWFRDYVYIPLGGSRTSIAHHLFNMFLVWLLTGIWHGANYTFIAWGLGYFILLVLEKYIIKPEIRNCRFAIVLWQIITLLCINFGWVIFNSCNLKSGILYCLAMIGYYKVPVTIDVSILYYIREYGVFIVLGIIFSTPIAKKVGGFTEKNLYIGTIQKILLPACYGILFLWAVSFLILGAHNPFIYFNF